MAVTKLTLSPMAKSPSKCRRIKQDQPLPSLARRVSFDESQNVVHENTAWTREDSLTHWYTRFDFQQMKEGSRMIAKQLSRRESRNPSEESYNKIMMRIYDACCNSKTEALVLSQQDQEDFYRIIRHSNNRFGQSGVHLKPE